jgi:hypothetical protein
VPAGTHSVRFTYMPASGVAELTMFGLGLLLTSASVVSRALGRRRRQPGTKPQNGQAEIAPYNRDVVRSNLGPFAMTSYDDIAVSSRVKTRHGRLPRSSRASGSICPAPEWLSATTARPIGPARSPALRARVSGCSVTTVRC